MALEFSDTIERTRRLVEKARAEGKSIGLVPTMGDLHEGHLSLVRACRKACGYAVLSIFVNPAQFGPGEDYERYPRPLEADLEKARADGVDLVFAPSPGELYPPGFRTFVEVGGISRVLCGRYRPGHFRGVATVVAKLFSIVGPDRAWFGMKDAQQLFVIRAMARDLDLGVEIIGLPTVREPDGLAMSSRNRYLSPEERAAAPGIYRALRAARDAVEKGPASLPAALAAARDSLERLPGFRLQYLSAVDRLTFRPASSARGPVLVLVAGHFGRTRLVDNLEIGPAPTPKSGRRAREGIINPATRRFLEGDEPFVAIDFETASSRADSACEIALVRVDGNLVTAVESRRIKPPERRFEFTWIHGITWEDVCREKIFGEVWPELLPLLEGVPWLVAHNASFDRSVLEACCHSCRVKPPSRERFQCTVAIARAVWGIRPTRLPMVCSRLGIGLEHHKAESDARACAEIVIRARQALAGRPELPGGADREGGGRG